MTARHRHRLENGPDPEVTLPSTDLVMAGMNGCKLVDEALKRRPELKVRFTAGCTRDAGP